MTQRASRPYEIDYTIDYISKLAENFFELARARTSSCELGQAKKPGKYHKCQSNVLFCHKLISVISLKVKKL